jgi:hypothetical protein
VFDAVVVAALRQVNQALDGDDVDATFTALRSSALKLTNVETANSSLYHPYLAFNKTQAGQDV